MAKRRSKPCSTRSRRTDGRAARRDQAHRPQAHGEFRRRADAQDRTAVQGTPRRPRPIARRVSGKIRRRDRKNPRRRLGQSRPHRDRVCPSRRIFRRRLRHPDSRCHHLSAGIERALRPHHEERQGDDRLCRPSRQLGIARRRRETDRGQIRRAVPAAEYRRRQRRHHQAARTADGRTHRDRPRRAGQTGAACCNPASMSACSPTSITAKASR